MTTTPHEEASAHATQALATISQEIDELDGWTIAHEDDNDFAASMLRDVKARHKALETKRKAITVPINRALKEINSLFRPPRERLEDAEKILKGKIAGYLEAVEAKNAAALEAAAAAETLDEATNAIALVTDAEAPKGVSVRYVYRPIVVDEGALDRRFLSPDPAKIKAWAKEHADADGKPLAIDGVKFERDAIVTSRSAP